MFFRQLFDRESCTYTYLIADLNTQEAVLVDPVLEQFERDYHLLQDLGFILRYCLETHIHADHITGTSKQPNCAVFLFLGLPKYYLKGLQIQRKLVPQPKLGWAKRCCLQV